MESSPVKYVESTKEIIGPGLCKAVRRSAFEFLLLPAFSGIRGGGGCPAQRYLLRLNGWCTALSRALAASKAEHDLTLVLAAKLRSN